MYLSSAPQSLATSLGGFASRRSTSLSTCLSLTKPSLNDGVDFEASVVIRLPMKSPGCGKSWYQSVKPICLVLLVADGREVDGLVERLRLGLEPDLVQKRT